MAAAWLATSLALAGCSSPPVDGPGLRLPPLPDQGTPDQPMLQVAILTPLSGELSTFGEAVRNGAGLALDEWNDRGGAGGQRLQARWVDTPCEADAARQITEQVIDDGVRFIVGGMCSEAAVPGARVADERGALFVATSATHPLVTVDPGGATRRLAFRVAFPYPYQGPAAARFLVGSLHITRTVVIADLSVPFAREVAAAFESALVAAGGQVLTTTSSIEQDADSEQLMAAVRGAGALYVPGDHLSVERVSRAVHAHGLAIPIVGSDWWSRHDLDLAALEGVYLVAHYSPDGPHALARDWAQRYQSAFAVEPDTLAALGYDAANLVATAIDRAADPSPAQVAAVIEAGEYAGVTGEWRFDGQHNPLKSAVFLQVRDGGLHWAAESDAWR